jgi:multidrug resistance efflux pump
VKKYKIYASFTGTYTDVFLEVGSAANPGSRIGKIIRTDQLELEVPIEVHNADWIKFKDPVYVTREDGSRELSLEMPCKCIVMLFLTLMRYS